MNFFVVNKQKTRIILSLLCGISTLQTYAQGTDKFVKSLERNKRDNEPAQVVFTEDASYTTKDADLVLSKYLSLNDPAVKLEKANTVTTKHNLTTTRYQQWYQGHKVADGVYVMLCKDDHVRSLSGNFYKIKEGLSATSALNRDATFDLALQFTGAETYMWQDNQREAFLKAQFHKPDTSYLPAGELVWIEDHRTGTETRTDGKLHLAYCFDIYASKPLSRQLVYVDANTGKILFRNSIIKHTAATGHSLYSGVIPFQTAHTSSPYILYDSTRGNGVHTMNMNHGTDYGTATEFTSAANTWPNSIADTAALDAQWAAEKVYDYWDSVQNRLSWDNMNSILTQYVHFNTSYDNAFWDGTEMTYGDGSGLAGGGFLPLVSLDVTAHEIGHGVCQATANLNYEGESGGMNEGFSDCWGATIENWANPHEVDAVPKQVWKIGEEIGGGNPLRSMDAPKLQGQPDTYEGINWVTTIGCVPNGGNDECGVHTNSGILNHWYYILVHGASGTNDNGNSYSVTGIGFAEGADILYQTELLLVPTSQYYDCRAASLEATATLFGPCSPEFIAVTNAWYAVGVGPAFLPCTPQIGFVHVATHVSENAPDTACNASHVLNIPIKPLGLPITGGTASLTVNVTAGTAIAGKDYALPVDPSFTFAPGDTTTKILPVTIYDNGAVNDDKYLVLGYTLNAMGSDAIVSPTNAHDTLFISNDDKTPELGHMGYYQIGDSMVQSNLTSAFRSANRTDHSQFLILANELAASGILPNEPITQLAFKVAVKNSTIPYPAYTVSMANTLVGDLDTGFVTSGFTTVYSANYTTFIGWDSLDFTTPFVWDGTSNVAVNVCFTNTGLSSAGNDKMDGYTGAVTVTAYTTSNSPTVDGCTLGYNPMQTSTARPIIRFKQTVPPSRIETVAHTTRSWNVNAGQEVYFYAPVDTGLMMCLKNPSADLGCVNTTLTAEGTGFTPFPFAPGVNRSFREFSMTPTTNVATTTYKATLYFTNTEMGSTAATVTYIIKTDAATDADISAANTVAVTPALSYGADYVGFTGDFTGFSRFFLVDGFVSGIPSVTAGDGADFRVDNNPFHGNINISYTSLIYSSGTLALFDVLGQKVLSVNADFSAGKHTLSINVPAGLAQGTYILRITTPEQQFTTRLTRE